MKKIPKNKRVYLDESGFNQFLFRDYARGPRGTQIIGEISGQRFARQSIVAALSKGKILSPMCFEGICDTKVFNVWLKEVLIPNLTPGQVLILDNASFHKSPESRRLVESSGCKLLFLPPYSPDLNPIEKCWANMKAKVRELLPIFQKFTDALDRAILSM